MKKTTVFVMVFLMFLVVISTVSAQNILENIQSGRLSDSMGNFMKNNIFRWYTTVGGELNPAYTSQRMLVDAVLLFTLFLSLMWVSVKNIFKDASDGAKTSIAVVTATIFTIGLIGSGFSLGAIGPFIKPVFFFLFAFLIYNLISKVIKAETILKKILALVITLVLVWFMFNAFNLIGGEPITLFGGISSTGRTGADYTERILTSSGQYSIDSTNPATKEELATLYYKQALTHVENEEYELAEDNFIKIIELEGTKKDGLTIKWLEVKLFEHMVRSYRKAIKGEYLVAKILVKRAYDLPPGSEERKELIEKAKIFYKNAKEKNAIIKAAAEEIAKEVKTE